MSSRRLLRLLACALVSTVLVVPALPTWSIVVVDTRTREVAVGTATCISGFDIRKTVPVLVPEYGAGASQAVIDSAALLRKRMRRGLLAGIPPGRILTALSQVWGHQQRQFGIVNMTDMPVTFTGNKASAAAGGVIGISGDLRYAIQGNILVDPVVWLEAEQALLNTPGDLSQKLMAAMEAARAWGGDGRCSCTSGPPTSCGAPPPGFTKSAHCAFVGVARVGDSLGICNSTTGCASGDYFLELNFPGNVGDPDPVLVLQGMYTSWRQALQGRPDQVLSEVAAAADALVADGHSTTQVGVRLVDVEGVPLTTGGMTLSLELLAGSSGATQAGAVVDNGDGTYSFSLAATSTPGQDTWRVRVTDAVGTVVLQPDVAIRVDPLAPLHLGLDGLSASAGGAVPFTLNLGAAQAGQAYVILGSASGTQPGTVFGGQNVPLNVDRLHILTLVGAKPPLFSAFQGVLDADGRAEAAFEPYPGLLLPFAGVQTDWAGVVLGSAPTVVGPVGLDVLP